MSARFGLGSGLVGLVGLGRPLAVLAMSYAVLSCAATDTHATSSGSFADTYAAMEDHIEPTVDELIPSELTKDPDEVDFVAIGRATRIAAAVFEDMSKQGSRMYAKSGKDRRFAAKAAAWFASLGDAARDRDHPRLVRAFTLEKTICTQCHTRGKW